jgi:hypothetical protein
VASKDTERHGRHSTEEKLVVFDGISSGLVYITPVKADQEDWREPMELLIYDKI